MPRYYNLTITQPGAAAGAAPYRQWTTNPASGYDPGALDIAFDVLVSQFHTPVGGKAITVYGVALTDLLQAAQFAGTPANGNTPATSGMILRLYGGMSKGLPLVNPKQAGLLLEGQIIQSYGNWIGTNMSVDFVVKESTYTPDAPGNIVLTWRAGQTLQSALAQTFSTAYPGVKQNFSISQNLVLPFDEVAHYTTLETLSQALFTITTGQIVSDDYYGVAIAYQGGELYAFDHTLPPPSTVAIEFNDLIGQPVWIDQNVMQVTTVLRSDILVASTITMPKGLQNAPGAVQTIGQSLPNALKYKTTFQGSFAVQQVRHVGNLRAPDAESWVSIFNCAPAAATS